MNNDSSFEYLYTVHSDIRDTIRAIDLKISFLLVGYVIPLSHIEDIIKAINGFPCLLKCLSVFSCFIWFFGGYLCVRVLYPIKAPSVGEGVNYNPDIMKMFYFSFSSPCSLSSLFLDSKSNNPSVSVEIIESLSNDESLIRKALIFDIFKLSYVRDYKAYRCKFAILCFIFVFLIGFPSVFFSRLFGLVS